MNVLLLFLLSTTILYVATLFRWRKAWQNTSEASLPLGAEKPFLSVVVALRNEADNIESLIKSLEGQTYPASHFEVILVNDHSTDNTEKLLKTHTGQRPNFKMINSGTPGKKIALREGIAQALGDVVVTTDADCLHHKGWLDTIARHQASLNPDMTIAPVAMVAGENRLSKLFELEFMALQMATAASAINNQPIMCNGANLTVRRRHHFHADLKDGYVSGDDMFLLMSLKKENGHIVFLKHRHALVTTLAPLELQEYLRQRSRWLRKATGYTQPNILTTATIMFLGNMAWPAAIFAGLCTMDLIPMLLGIVLFIVKYTSDYLLLKSGSEFYNIRTKHQDTLLLALLYPAMIVAIATMTLLRNRKKW